MGWEERQGKQNGLNRGRVRVKDGSIWGVGVGTKPPRTNHFNGDLICRPGRNRPQFEAVMESFLGQATSDMGTIR